MMCCDKFSNYVQHPLWELCHGQKTTVLYLAKPWANFDVLTFPRFLAAVTIVDLLHNGMYSISSSWRLDTFSSGSQGLCLAKVISGELNLAHLCQLAVTILELCLAWIRKLSDHNHNQQGEANHEPPAPPQRQRLCYRYSMAALAIALSIDGVSL